MERDKITSLSGQLKAFAEVNKDFPHKLKQRLVSESSRVGNPFKFIVELFNEGVLCDGSSDLEAYFGFKEMLVQLAVTIGCSKGADGVGGLVKALESSGNLQLLSAIQIWAKEELVIESDDDGSPSGPEGDTSALESPPRKKPCRNVPSPTELGLKNQPRHSTTGLFAATEGGLISLDMQTLETAVLTSESTLAVAVNHNLKKVYWSEGFYCSSIMRSKFDGTTKEIIVPHKGDRICMLAIDESSGNVYYSVRGSNEITVCNALGLNCAVVISNAPLVKDPVDIALDSENGVMYWGNRPESSPNSLVRANLDGSNATIISTGFTDLYGITLDQPSKDVLYWADNDENAIGSIQVHDGNKRTLVKLEDFTGPYRIQVDAQKIYFSDCNSRNIQSVDRDSGNELTAIFNSSEDVYDFALFRAPVKQS